MDLQYLCYLTSYLMSTKTKDASNDNQQDAE